MANTKAGKIIHYFGKIQVAVVMATDGVIKVGDQILIGEEGAGVNQTIESLQVDHQPVTEIIVGQEAGMKVASPVKEGNVVYKVA